MAAHVRREATVAVSEAFERFPCRHHRVGGPYPASVRYQPRPATWLRDVAIGLCIAAPVYWMFTQLLAINLPGLTSTGWL